MVSVICKDLIKVRVKAETANGVTSPQVTVGKYFWITLQAHGVMEYFIQIFFCQHPEVSPNPTLYLFENRNPRE